MSISPPEGHSWIAVGNSQKAGHSPVPVGTLKQNVIFDGNENHIGKVVKVKVQTSNQNTLFGLLDKKMEAA